MTNRKYFNSVLALGGILAAIFLINKSISSNLVYLYAWERPEDFSFLDENSKTTIVFYAGDLVIKDNKIFSTLRRNLLNIPDGLNHFPLIRIDSFESPDVLMANIDQALDFIVRICYGFNDCQIDFEARTSEYEFYSALLDRVEKALPDKNISITALASWCSGEILNDLSIKNAVPMLYRMGKDSKNIKDGSVGKWFLSNNKCSDSIALSVDELDFDPREYIRGKSVYLFNPEPWTKDSYQKALSYLGL